MLPKLSISQNKEVTSIIATAKLEFDKKNYYGAAKLYKDALNHDKRMYDIIWKIAESSRYDNDYIEAANYYRILCDKVPEKYPNAYYYYALMLKSNEDYVKAQYFFHKFINNDKTDGTNILVTKALKELIDCEIAWKMLNTPNGFNIIQCDTNINSVYSDFSTHLDQNSILLFTSIQPNNNIQNNYKSKVYSYDLNKNNPPKLFDNIINVDGYDISNPHLNSKSDKLYFTLSDIYKGGNTYIYESEYINEEWTKPKKLPDFINFPNYNSTQPFLIEKEDNNILLWSSDRPGGEGGFDIYYCTVLNDNYGSVMNLGRPIIEKNQFSHFYDTTSVINTPGNEITPYYNIKDSTLYFSSDWHQNMGGYDIFYVKGDFISWGNINNIGYPINSAQNDFYYKIYPDKHIAFFTSNRKSAYTLSHQSCCNDIFYHNIEHIIDEKIIEKQRIELLTERTKLLVPITLYFHNDVPNPNSWDTLTILNYTDTYYEYLNMKNNYRKNYSKGLGKSEKLAAIDSIDYYFSYNVQESFNNLLEFTNLMKELLQSNQKIEITIKGYTSPLNTIEYNNNLSKRRISSLVNYFNEFEDGIFLQYVESGLLSYNFVAFGKTLSNTNVADDPNDPRNSIYSPEASRERRIEIIAISIENFKQNLD